MSDLYVGLVAEDGTEFASYFGTRSQYRGTKAQDCVDFYIRGKGRVAGAFLTPVRKGLAIKTRVFPFSSGTFAVEPNHHLRVTVNPEYKQ